MPTPVYRDILTEESRDRLVQLVQDLPHPVALAGGHAVRYIVQANWMDRFGEGYFGSRDIDVCYYVDPEWTTDEFRNSAAGRAPQRISEIGYKPMGLFRFGLWVDADGNVLDEEPESPSMLGVDYDILCIDPMVTHVHQDAKEVLGYNPIDEPLLAHTFTDETLRTTVDEFGPDVYVPTAPLLSTTKLNSLPDRDKLDKAVKDLCDIYVLAAHGGASNRAIRTTVHQLLPTAPELVRGALNHESLPTALDHLDLVEADFNAVVGPLELPP